jgi:hypothetical protein
MRRLAVVALLCTLAAGCGGGGSSPADDLFVQQQTAACKKVTRALAAIPRAKRTAVAIDEAFIHGVRTLAAVQAPPKLAATHQQWLAAVRSALHARLRLDTAPAGQLRRAARAEVTARRAANRLAGALAIASGCTLLP